MKNKWMVLFLLALMSVTAWSCKLVDFTGQNIYLTFTLDRAFDVVYSGDRFGGADQVDLHEVFGDLDFASVEGISISAIEVTITRNNTGPNTTASGQIAFNRVSSPFPTDIVLASFSNVNLNSVLNRTMSPFGTPPLLDVSAAGINQFKAVAASMPVIRLGFSGRVSSPPVDFSARISIVFQVKLRTS